jgi:hypothetical protein
MRRLIKELLLGKNNFMSGVIALGIVSAIALGCNCNKDFGNTGTNTESNSTVANTEATPKKTSPEDALSDTSRGDVPSEREMERLVKRTLLDFNDAVQKGDFTDFHSKISDVWKKTSTPEKFNQGFAEFIQKDIDISTIEGKVATFDPKPNVKRKSGYKVLEAKGKYDTSPLPVRFENEYIQEGGDWKLISIRVDTRQ